MKKILNFLEDRRFGFALLIVSNAILYFYWIQNFKK